MSKFTVKGVDNDSGFDSVLVIQAESAANARAKAELKGMKVTEVVDHDRPAPVAVPAPPSPQAKPSRPGVPVCQQCGGAMKKHTQSSGNCSGLAIALIVFCVGVVIAILIPIIGWVAGPIICILALFMGGKRSKVWRCVSCKSIVPRG